MLCSRCPTIHTSTSAEGKKAVVIHQGRYSLNLTNSRRGVYTISLPGKSYSMSSFLAMTRHEYGCCRLINGTAVPVHYYGTFTIYLIPFLQITWVLLIIFPWGEQQLIGKESGEILIFFFKKEYWLLKYIKYSFLKQGGEMTAGPLISLGRR